VLQLLYFEGLSRSQVSERLGVSAATVHRRQREALGMLRVALEHEEEPVRVDDAELEAFLSTL
jgi:DNA-directed RNA polymerase specialized sigma24 family protein